MENIEIYAPEMDKKVVQRIIKFYNDADFSQGKVGGSSWYLRYKNYAILSTLIFKRGLSIANYKEIIKLVKELQLKGVNVALIHGFILNKDTAAERDLLIQQNVKGKTLFPNVISKTVDIKELILSRMSDFSFYKKMSKDFLDLSMSKIDPDFNPYNIIYNTEKGFHFIDFTKMKKQYNPQMIAKYIIRLLGSFAPTDEVLLQQNEDINRLYNYSREELHLVADSLIDSGLEKNTINHALKTMASKQTKRIVNILGEDQF